MPDSAAPPTELAEALLAQLAARADDHRLLARLGPVSAEAGRHLRWDNQSRHANALVDLVAVAESFSTGGLFRFLPAESSAPPATWKARALAWKSLAGIDPADFDNWSALMGFVQVRNALQHGLGRLTELQVNGKNKTQTLAWILTCGVDLNGDLLSITTADVDRCYRVSAAFIRFLDRGAKNI